MASRRALRWRFAGLAGLIVVVVLVLSWRTVGERLEEAVSLGRASFGSVGSAAGGSSGLGDAGPLGAHARHHGGDAGLVGGLGPWLPTATVTHDIESPHGTLAGRVVSRAGGLPVVGAELVFERDGSTVSATSGIDGRFVLVAADLGRHVLAIASAEGFLPYAPEWGHSPIAFTARALTRIDGVTIQLEPELEVDVEVVDRAGNPALDAEVSLIDAGSGDRSLAPVEAAYRTDAEGHVLVRAWRGALIEAHRDGARGRARARDGVARIQLSPRDAADGRIAGRVVGPRDVPIEGAVVRAFVPRRGAHGSAQAVSDEAGGFVLEGLDDATHLLTAEHPAHPRTRVINIVVGREDVEIRMPAGLSIAGRVVDSEGEPVSAFTIVAQRTNGLRRRTVASVSSYDAEGRFEVNGLEEDAEHVLVATARGFPSSAPVSASPGQSPTLTLQRGGRIEGVVRDEEGVPIEGARIRLSGYLGRGTSASPLGAQAMSGRSGDFVLDGIGAEPRTIQVDADGFHGRMISGLVVEAGGARQVEVSLSPVAEGETARTELAGIGVVLLPGEDYLVVRRVVPEGAAVEAGLQVGDRVLAIDGTPVTALGFGGSLEHIRGNEGTVVRLRVQSRGSEAAREVLITRRRIRT